MDRETVTQHCATILLNMGITYVLRMIFVRVNREYIAKNRGD